MGDWMHAPSVEWIQWLVLTQFEVVSWMAGITVGLLLFRRWKHRHIARLKNKLADLLIQELLARLDSASVAPLIPRPRFYQFLLADVSRDLLLEHIRSLSGTECEYLCQRYAYLGFVQRDLRDTSSRFWWRRLAAVSHLNVLGVTELAPVFHRLSHDNHELVAALALLALSSLRHDLNRPGLLSGFPRSILDRRNVMLEIVRNWARIYGAQDLILETEKTRNPGLLSILIAALSSLQSPDVAHVFSDLLARDTASYPPEAIAQMIQLLKNVGDPDCVPVVASYLAHPSDRVRQRAVELVIALGDGRHYDVLVAMQDDPSSMVQRELRKLSTTEAA